ncbi:MAG: 23S rRNA (pseudouridine(1915)-N(3))-methyltransferase RlmH [Lachnospiraceae bacterium]|nr:23S rRNA (pseudouridine(1915)-N(3))-methyltransferase RlmH [Lachnospiraceae bacterium]
MNFCVKILCVGKIKEDFYRAKLEEYRKSINKRVPFEIIELSDESIPANPNQSIMDKIKEKEGDKLLESINSRDFVVALCIEGKSTELQGMKKLIERARDNQNTSIIFVIGGSLGLDDRVIKRANYKLSFSNMTFPHQLMRVMLGEQIQKAVE